MNPKIKALLFWDVDVDVDVDVGLFNIVGITFLNPNNYSNKISKYKMKFYDSNYISFVTSFTHSNLSVLSNLVESKAPIEAYVLKIILFVLSQAFIF